MSTKPPVVEIETERPDFLEEGPSLPMVLTDDFVAKLEKGVTAYRRFLSVICRLTEATHWINHGTADKPSITLQGPGAEALCNPLGADFDGESLRFRRQDDRDENGEYYIIWCEGMFTSKTLNRRGYYIGSCDSRDQFFNARKGWMPSTGEPDIKKAAFTNWLVNAVTRIAGIRNPSPRMLEDAGIKLESINRITYGGEKGARTVTEPMIKVIWGKASGAKVPKDKIVNAIRAMGYHEDRLPGVMLKNEFDELLRWIEDGAKGAVPKGTGPEKFEKESSEASTDAAGQGGGGFSSAASSSATLKLTKPHWDALWTAADKNGVNQDTLATFLKKLGYADPNALLQKDYQKVLTFINAGGQEL